MNEIFYIGETPPKNFKWLFNLLNRAPATGHGYTGFNHRLDGLHSAKGEFGGELVVVAEGVEVLGHGADVVELGVGQRDDLEGKS